MSEPTDHDLMTQATPYALHAVTQSESEEIERQVADAPELVRRAFTDEVRAVRETMAVIAAATAQDPPARVRERLLAAIDEHLPLPRSVVPRRRNWRGIVVSAAAAIVIGATLVGVGWAIRPELEPATADRIFSASDVRTVSDRIAEGGTATVFFSHDRNAAVLVMNNVAPPKAGTVYQMWLVGADGARSAGTMDGAAVTPSTTAVLPDIGTSQALAFTVEPGGGSAQPTSPIFARLPLT